MQNQSFFKAHMDNNQMFSENILASMLSISKKKLNKIKTRLRDDGDIMEYMVYGSRLPRYKIEDVYVILTSYTGKNKEQILNKFKEEFFNG